MDRNFQYPDEVSAVNAAISTSINKPSFWLTFPRSLAADWWMTVLPPDAALTPGELPSDADWHRAQVPGTALQALESAYAPETNKRLLLHDLDVWYFANLDLLEGQKLKFRALAGLADIWLDDEPIGSSETMFVALTLPVTRDGTFRLSIRFRSLSVALQTKAGRPRWRTRLVESNALRKQRQTLLGHMPGWCPPIHAVGPYRSIDHVMGHGTIETCNLSTVTRGYNAVLSVRIVFAEAVDPRIRLLIQINGTVAALMPYDAITFMVDIVLADIELWWPHTHGNPKLYNVFLVDGTSELNIGKVGFRDLKVLRGDDGLGFRLQINGSSIFCRGACWTSADLLGLRHNRQAYLNWLELARDAGMNMIRISGTMLYESRDFSSLCDELGILVWQDLMFANLDYATDEIMFQQNVIAEVKQLIEELAGNPSLVVLCGGSEIAQQSTMLGLSADRRTIGFFESFLPELIRKMKPDLLYVPNSPWGGPLPIDVSIGISHYYGVGAYRRPLEDARRANVRFVTECLAFSNPAHPNSPAAKAIVDGPQDPGASWTFADVRDHYLQELYLIDPNRLRAEDPRRYFDLSRAVIADVMEAVFSEWRRPKSSCTGALVWQLQDLAPASGWGVIDSSGYPKAAWHGLHRVLAPVQVLVSDERTDGLEIHVINETATAMAVVIHLTCLSNGSVPIISGTRSLTLPARDSLSLSSHDMLDGFFDITRTYRFGPAEHNVTVAALRCATSGTLLSEAFHFPTDRLLPLDDLGMTAKLLRDQTGWSIEISTKRFAQAVHFELEYYRSSVDWFHLPPLEARQVKLVPLQGLHHDPAGIVRAINGRKPVLIQAQP